MQHHRSQKIRQEATQRFGLYEKVNYPLLQYECMGSTSWLVNAATLGCLKPCHKLLANGWKTRPLLQFLPFSLIFSIISVCAVSVHWLQLACARHWNILPAWATIRLPVWIVCCLVWSPVGYFIYVPLCSLLMHYFIHPVRARMSDWWCVCLLQLCCTPSYTCGPAARVANRSIKYRWDGVCVCVWIVIWIFSLCSVQHWGEAFVCCCWSPVTCLCWFLHIVCFVLEANFFVLSVFYCLFFKLLFDLWSEAILQITVINQLYFIF